MISMATFMGGAWKTSIASDFTINPLLARVWDVTPSGGAGVLLPSTSSLRPGGPVVLIVNNGPGSLPVKSSAGVTLFSLSSGTMAMMDVTPTSWRWMISSWSAA